MNAEDALGALYRKMMRLSDIAADESVPMHERIIALDMLRDEMGEAKLADAAMVEQHTAEIKRQRGA